MYLLDQQLILSPSDLNGFVECRHLSRLDLAYAHGERSYEPATDPIAELLATKGVEHERAYLEGLRQDGREIVEIPDPDDRSLDALHATAEATEEAMRSGAEVIFQATFLQPAAGADGHRPTHYRGHADFLFRVERPSELGPWSYEVADAKLARRAKPYFLVQLCFYSELLQRVQGGEPPERIHVILGSGERQSFRLAEFSAYFRRVRDRFRATLEQEVETYPEPVAHCAVCRWQARCDAQRLADDHLSLVAGIHGSHREKLKAAGIETLAALGSLPAERTIAGIRPEMLARLREQASLQLRGRTSTQPLLDLLPPEPGRGFARLPEPSPGDVFFDMEGDPFFEGGLEYLFGYVTHEHGEPEFTVLWGRDRAEEKQALERFIDLITDRRRRWPDLHVYHYAHYEVAALKRLAGAHGSREAELDQLLRDEVFVDLCKVVREALRIGQPSYGLKKVEAYYMDQRDTAVTDGSASTVEFERWLAERDQVILDRIADYNRDDCLSTLRLRDWLLERRSDAIAAHGAEIEWFIKHEGQPDATEPPDDHPSATLRRELLAGLPDNRDTLSGEERIRWLLAQLLDYHRREARPVWWAFFDRIDTERQELIDDVECIGDLDPTPGSEPEPVRQSERRRMSFPAQETKMGPGKVIDPDHPRPQVKIDELDLTAGTLTLIRGPGQAGNPWPRALIPGGPYQTQMQEEALRRLAERIRDEGPHSPGPYRACRDILLGEPPRVAGHAPGSPLHSTPAELEELKRIVRGLEESYLLIQGPPGSGKTYSGARLIVDLLDCGRRVGVTSTSHKAIENMLDEVDRVAAEQGVDFNGLKKASADRPDSAYSSPSGRIESSTDNAAVADPEVDLPAGTAWHFCREECDGSLDYLFIDEAGQISLADALALGTCAQNVVLLGDPQQLPQVTQAAHPNGSGISVMAHLLGDAQTIAPERGVFLDRSWRLHPDVCAYVSELMYDGRLESAPGREAQRILGEGELRGTGLRWLPVEHAGNAQSSDEEAERVAAVLAELDGASYRDAEGAEHPLTLDDILVITPFNAQVNCLERHLPAGARIGTVDRFQGQEAQVAIYSMATSSGAQVPRRLEFLFNRNRLNVAISRARSLAIVIASPRLPEIDCRTVEQMRLVNALCRVAEVGGEEPKGAERR